MELKAVVDLWKRSRQRSEEVYLATVVHVQGSSYRKPGAYMLVSASGERAGTISGGCLEAEVSKKIAWLTARGSIVESYRSSFDDDNEGAPYGLGCGGSVWILMEASTAAEATLAAMERALDLAEPSIVVHCLRPGAIAKGVARDASALRATCACLPTDLVVPAFEVATRSMESSCCVGSDVSADCELPEIFCMPVMPPRHIHIFGAGDDAQPLCRMAAELGWQISVLDGRSHLLKQERFPAAKELVLLRYSEPSLATVETRELGSPLQVKSSDFAVVMTHSYEQDRAVLRALLPLPVRYLGILGPRHRTERIVKAVAPQVELSPEECLEKLHAPVGLAIGSVDPASIALSILAEMQAESARTTQPHLKLTPPRRRLDTQDRGRITSPEGHREVFETEIAFAASSGVQ